MLQAPCQRRMHVRTVPEESKSPKGVQTRVIDSYLPVFEILNDCGIWKPNQHC